MHSTITVSKDGWTKTRLVPCAPSLGEFPKYSEKLESALFNSSSESSYSSFRFAGSASARSRFAYPLRSVRRPAGLKIHAIGFGLAEGIAGCDMATARIQAPSPAIAPETLPGRFERLASFADRPTCTCSGSGFARKPPTAAAASILGTAAAATASEAPVIAAAAGGSKTAAVAAGVAKTVAA